MVLRRYNYVMEPTGTNSPSQNGAVKIYSNKLAIHARTLLYGSGLPAKFWSATQLHLVYLANRLVHLVMKTTPFEAFYGMKPMSHILSSLDHGFVSRDPAYIAYLEAEVRRAR